VEQLLGNASRSTHSHRLALLMEGGIGEWRQPLILGIYVYMYIYTYERVESTSVFEKITRNSSLCIICIYYILPESGAPPDNLMYVYDFFYLFACCGLSWEKVVVVVSLYTITVIPIWEGYLMPRHVICQRT